LVGGSSRASRLTLDHNDVLSGPLPTDAGTAISVYHDGSRWAGSSVRAGVEGEGPSFSCQLPPVPEARDATVEVRDAAGKRIFERAILHRVPRFNAFGLLASDVFEPGHPPLNAITWMSFDGARLSIGGAHLPPHGDPLSLGVRFGPGVAYAHEYPLRSVGWEDVYWYWPNAANSNLLVTIDLLASAFDSDPFHCEFVETRHGETHKLSDLWLPNDLRSFMTFTSDTAKIDRVQKGVDAHSIVLPGYSQFRYLESQFARFGIRSGPGVGLLDWGCGVGRLTAHFIANWPRATVCGTDIDSANVHWCAASFGEDRFSVAPLWPRTKYAGESFDGVFGVSVMTHLTAEAQAAWLAELARILKPGGIALLTFAGSAGKAYGSRWRAPAGGTPLQGASSMPTVTTTCSMASSRTATTTGRRCKRQITSARAGPSTSTCSRRSKRRLETKTLPCCGGANAPIRLSDAERASEARASAPTRGWRTWPEWPPRAGRFRGQRARSRHSRRR